MLVHRACAHAWGVPTAGTSAMSCSNGGSWFVAGGRVTAAKGGHLLPCHMAYASAMPLLPCEVVGVLWAGLTALVRRTRV